MKSRTFIWIIFLLTLISCKEAITPEVPSPKIILATVNPTIAKYNGSAVITYEAINAKEVSIGGKIMPSIKGTYELKGLKSSTEVNID
jgi:hypothetical protein